MGGEPYPIWHQVGIRVRNRLSAGRRIERHVARAPLVDVGVPVAIRETTGIVVKSSGPINNLGDRSADTEAGIVDAPGAFVRGHEDLRRAGGRKIGHPAKGGVWVVMFVVGPVSIQPRAAGRDARASVIRGRGGVNAVLGTDRGIHGNAAGGTDGLVDHGGIGALIRPGSRGGGALPHTEAVTPTGGSHG